MGVDLGEACLRVLWLNSTSWGAGHGTDRAQRSPLKSGPSLRTYQMPRDEESESQRKATASPHAPVPEVHAGVEGLDPWV